MMKYYADMPARAIHYAADSCYAIDATRAMPLLRLPRARMLCHAMLFAARYATRERAITIGHYIS